LIRASRAPCPMRMWRVVFQPQGAPTGWSAPPQNAFPTAVPSPARPPAAGRDRRLVRCRPSQCRRPHCPALIVQAGWITTSATFLRHYPVGAEHPIPRCRGLSRNPRHRARL
jgi:hypothetical protein